MDVYGYPPYPYNQADELGKQVFAQQALASSIPDNRVMPGPGQGPHVMPAPTGHPWNVQGVSWGLPSPPQLMYFTAAGRQALEQGNEKIAPIHCKRKSLDVEPVIPAKQRITEEKMAAHLNGLHISSDYTPHSLSNDEFMDMEPIPSTSTGVTADKLKGHTIVLAEEIRKLQEEPLLPAALIERMEKPRMSLVVWKPRENILNTLKEEEKQAAKDNESSPKRNGVLVPEQSQTTEDVEM